MQNLARYVFRSGNPFPPGFVEDDEAGNIETPNASVIFVCVVGATHDEYDASKHWRTASVATLLHEQNPVMITDLARRSVMELPRKSEGIGPRAAPLRWVKRPCFIKCLRPSETDTALLCKLLRTNLKIRVSFELNIAIH